MYIEYYLSNYSLSSLHYSFILCDGFVCLLVLNPKTFRLLAISLVYLISSIYFSMCFLENSKLRIAVSDFVIICSMYIEYYLSTYSSSSLHYLFIISNVFTDFCFVSLVGSNGIEPSTSRLSGVRSNHLSYEPIY